MNTVELLFPLRAESAPVDHGYSLYSAICRRIPEVHGARWFSVHPLSGRQVGEELILSQGASLRLRVPSERIATVLPLAGSRLDIDGHGLAVGMPQVLRLVPSPSLDARLVVVRVTDMPKAGEQTDEDAFRAAFVRECTRQLAAMGASDAVLTLCGKRSIRVKDQRIRGFSVRVANLTEDGSLALLAKGLGGKRSMSCGVFRATRGR